jgi:hypothetical protein
MSQAINYSPSTSRAIATALISRIQNWSDADIYEFFCDSPFPLPDEAFMALFEVSKEDLPIIKAHAEAQFNARIIGQIRKKEAVGQ